MVNKSQPDKFKQAARDLETDNDEKRFDETLGKLAGKDKSWTTNSIDPVILQREIDTMQESIELGYIDLQNCSDKDKAGIVESIGIYNKNLSELIAQRDELEKSI